MGWMIDFRGAKLREEDVLNAHVTLANQMLETTGWDSINPMQSPEALIVWTAIAISENTKTSIEESVTFVQRLKLHEVIGCFNPDAPPEPPPQVRSEPRNPPSSTNGAQLSPEQQAARQSIIDQMVAQGR